MHAVQLALFPGPIQLSIACRPGKQRGPAIFCYATSGQKGWYKRLNCGWVGPVQQKEPRYQVTYHTYIVSGRRLSCTLCIEHVVGLTIWKTQPVYSPPAPKFAIFWLRHTHVKKDTRLSPLFRTASDGKLGRAWEERGYGLVMCKWVSSVCKSGGLVL